MDRGKLILIGIVIFQWFMVLFVNERLFILALIVTGIMSYFLFKGDE